MTTAREYQFDLAYKEKRWGGGSGPGSLPETTAEYRKLVEDLIRRLNVRNVIDVGCGDGLIASLIDWGNAHYEGVDISGLALGQALPRFQAGSVGFRRLDIVTTPVYADLVLLKDVLQHLTFSDIRCALKNLRGCRHVLITNDFPPDDERMRNLRLSGSNFRPLDMREKPFGLNAELVLLYEPAAVEHGHQPLRKASFLWQPR